MKVELWPSTAAATATTTVVTTQTTDIYPYPFWLKCAKMIVIEVTGGSTKFTLLWKDIHISGHSYSSLQYFLAVGLALVTEWRT